MTPIGVPDWLGENIATAEVSGLWVVRNDPGEMPNFAGAYALGLRLDKVIQFELPRLGSHLLTPSWYIYLGSARGSGGIRARVKRHFNSRKIVHWHIDRLSVESVEMVALAVAGGNECELVSKLLNSLRFKVAVAGFGSTDCRLCESHLLVSTCPELECT